MFYLIVVSMLTRLAHGESAGNIDAINIGCMTTDVIWTNCETVEFNIVSNKYNVNIGLKLERLMRCVIPYIDRRVFKID